MSDAVEMRAQAIKPGFPEGWQEVALGEVCEVVDSLHKTPKYSKEGYPMVRVTDIKGGPLDTDCCLRVSRDVFEEFSKKHKPKMYDIVFSRVGSQGNSCLVKSDDEFCLGQNTVFIVPSINKQFVYYWLNSPVGQEEIISSTTGTTQRTISMKSIKGLFMLVPSIEEQKAIAGVLSAFDDKIELLREQNQTLEQTAQTIFNEWFGKYSPDESAEKVLDFTKGVEVGSKNYSEEKSTLINPVIFYRVGDIAVNGNVAGIFTEKELSKDRLFEKSDVMVSFDGTVGRVFIGSEGAYSSGIRKIHAKEDYSFIESSFVYFWAKSQLTQKTIMLYSEGTTIQHASKSIPYLTVTSDKKAILEIQNQISPFFHKILINLKQIQTLTKTRDTLLPKLMTGEVRVGEACK